MCKETLKIPPIQIKPVAEKLSRCNMDRTLLVGFDGFVDEIVEAVDTRVDADNYKRIETISDFGNRILKSSNVGGNIEFVTKYEKLGGNGPIMANALISMGYPTYYAGNIGSPDIHPLFKDMAGKCKEVFSLAQPGHTDAVEFSDGKIMIGKHSTLKEVNWESLKNAAGERLPELLSEVDFIAATNWTMLTGMNGIWEGITEGLSKAQREKKVKFFCDLADPAKRTREDIRSALDLLSKMNKVADVILGLNKNEAKQIAGILELEVKNEEQEGITQLASDIREKLDLSVVVIHPIQFASAASKDGSASVEGPYAGKPKLSTGAGDNFNAGFCSGLLCDLSLEEALISGVSTSGFYVRNAHSPSKEELISFIDSWAEGKVEK